MKSTSTAVLRSSLRRLRRPASLLPALLLVTGLLLQACTAAAPGGASGTQAQAGATTASTSASTSTTSVSRADTLIFAGDLSDQISLDPAVAYEFGGIQVVGNVYETLVSFDPGKPGIKPLLAKSWDIKDTGDTWNLDLSPEPGC